jgi:putative FmdB family regulatory protein
MPQYSYRCRTCSHRFEKVSTIANRNQPEYEVCPSCLAIESVYLAITSAPVIGYHIAPGLRTSDNFNSRLKEVKARSGKDNTVGDSIR